MQDIVQHVLTSLEETSHGEAHMRINYRTKGMEGVVRVSRGALADCFTVEFGGLRVHVDGVDATAQVVSSRIVDADRGEEVSVCLLLGDKIVYGPRPVQRPADASGHQGMPFFEVSVAMRLRSVPDTATVNEHVTCVLGLMGRVRLARK